MLISIKTIFLDGYSLFTECWISLSEVMSQDPFQIDVYESCDCCPEAHFSCIVDIISQA